METPTTQITGVTQLRDDLLKVYSDARADKIKLDQVKEFANLAGKVLKTARIQIEYQSLMKTQNPIPFLEL